MTARDSVSRSVSVPGFQEYLLSDKAVFALIGESGCGKSTLLRILGGLLAPSSGCALLESSPVSEALAKKRVGWLAQNPALLPWKTVRANIALALEINPQKNRNTFSPDTLLKLINHSARLIIPPLVRLEKFYPLVFKKAQAHMIFFLLGR